MKHVKIYNVICIIAALLVAISGCKKDEDDAPAIPPANTFEMNFSLPAKSKSAIADIAADTSTSNFQIASFTVGVWALAAGVVTLIPAAAFKAVINNSKPTYDDVNKVWVWTVQFNFAGGNHEAELTGKLSGDSVHWVMNITTWIGTAALSEDKWFEGTAHKERTGGWWILYDKAKGACLKLDWKRESENVGSLLYTNIIQGDANKGGFIEFGSVATGDFDKYFKAKGKSNNPDVSDKLCTIEWNSSTKVGHIIVSDINATLKFCWDSNLINTVCP